ncbi:MAG: 16S rRNA (cytosine(1402)-N(4))-methyltransferase RsmH [bacterium]|nr:16S rRNA (cytosine(1402)-N(4))-methyltransferase RsmH [bacterium]
MIISLHTTVLLKESIDGLNIKKSDVYLDGTLGGGGHFLLALERGAKLAIGLDRDEMALARVRAKIEDANFSKYVLMNEDFRMMDKVVVSLGLEKVDKILLDLGLSSDQLDMSGRGFTFQKDEPLLMTFKKNPGPNDLTAEKIVNTWDEENIADIIYGWGEENFSRKIAKAIVSERAKKPINTTFELKEIISKAVPGFARHGRIHPATKTFQALRITVNDEIRALEEALEKGFALLNSSGRMGIISFHSLEDRRVKNFYRNKSDEGLGKLITKKPIVPEDGERLVNPRSRSAKLRIIEKI